MSGQYRELSEIDVKYRSKVSKGHKTIRIDTDDYIALYNMAEYSEILQNEQEQKAIDRANEEKYYWGEL